MIDFIPLSSYELFYNFLVGGVVLILGGYSYARVGFVNRPNSALYALTFLLFVLIWLLLGLRPISYTFGDMGNYNISFELLLLGGELPDSDVLFHWLMKFCADYLNANWFFFICFSVYIFPFYIALNRWFKSNWIWPFVLMVSLFSFYSFGVNGIRNGMGTSVFLLALSYRGPVRWILFYAAFGLHSSLALPIAAAALFTQFKNINYYVYGWLGCLVLTLAMPGIGELLAGMGILDDKLTSYINVDINEAGMGIAGFRIDFLLFSLLPICIGIFYIYKLNFDDATYNEILAVYITANAFWLLVIRIPFSNRFAYLSWFLYGLVIAYPLVKSSLLRYSNRYYSLLLVGLFTFSVAFF